MRKSSLKLVKNEILEFDARKKPEGFYLTGRHLRSVGRVVQRLHASTPYCFLHADSERLASYYTKLIVRKIELLGENLILRFNPLRKGKLIDVLNKEIENSNILYKYSNQSNPEAHYYGTAEEIIKDFNNNLDMVVISVGTGGTITGIAKRLKEEMPAIKIIGADPEGSILGGGEKVSSYLVEGIGYDFIPDVLDNSLVDEYIKTKDEESFIMARRLIKEEGLLCGGSCGATMVAALKAASKLKNGQNCLVILADGIRNYMTKFPNDSWMEENGFEISTLKKYLKFLFHFWVLFGLDP